MEKLHPEEKLFAGQLENHQGTIGYKIEIEEQRKETCNDLVLTHIGKEKLFTCETAPAPS